jgi:hypothetical protein
MSSLTIGVKYNLWKQKLYVIWALRLSFWGRSWKRALHEFQAFGLVAAVTARGWALLVPGSSCGLAAIVGLTAGLLFVARCQRPHAGQPCWLVPRALLRNRLWSRHMRVVPHSSRY